MFRRNVVAGQLIIQSVPALSQLATQFRLLSISWLTLWIASVWLEKEMGVEIQD